MSGKLLQKTTLDNSDYRLSRWQSWLLILIAGFVAVALHKVFRWPMELPGRHGLELMAILIFVRCSMNETYAASLSAVGGILALTLTGHHFMVDGSILFAQGITIDLLYKNIILRHRISLGLLSIVAGLAHLLKPIIKFGYQYGADIYSDALTHGLFYPILTHFIFGFVGGLLGWLAWQAIDNVRQSNHL